MRNRTELVTTTLPADSDNEEEGSIDDSEEDWQPEKVSEKKKANNRNHNPLVFQILMKLFNSNCRKPVAAVRAK